VKKGIVLGGGMAGLVSASLLAARGYEIILLENGRKIGEKWRSLQLGDYRFDVGSSRIIMPWMFERVFREVGKTIDPALRFIPLPINSRNFFYNGTVVDLAADPDAMSKQLARFSPENRQGFLDYILAVQQIYEQVEDAFFEHPMMPGQSRFSLGWMRPFPSMDTFHRTYFDDVRLLALMNRYATYVGSSPYLTSATQLWISYLELVQGVYYVEGGNDRILEAFERLAHSVGVQMYTQSAVDEVIVQEQRVVGVRAGKERWEADFIISNLASGTIQEKLLPTLWQEKKKASPGLSGYLSLFGVNRKYAHLHHHNLFFPKENGREFIDIFEQKKWSLSPTIYICNSSFSEPERAKQGRGSNLSVLIHVPAQHAGEGEDERRQAEKYRDHVLHWLQSRCGLQGLSSAIEVEKCFGPAEITAMFGAYGGRLSGSAIHRMWDFFRPTLKKRKIAGLYDVEGATCLDGGAPLAVLRGIQVAQMIQRDDINHHSSYLQTEV
jgi:phytoene desaturase